MSCNAGDPLHSTFSGITKLKKIYIYLHMITWSPENKRGLIMATILTWILMGSILVFWNIDMFGPFFNKSCFRKGKKVIILKYFAKFDIQKLEEKNIFDRMNLF